MPSKSQTYFSRDRYQPDALKSSNLPDTTTWPDLPKGSLVLIDAANWDISVRKFSPDLYPDYTRFIDSLPDNSNPIIFTALTPNGDLGLTGLTDRTDKIPQIVARHMKSSGNRNKGNVDVDLAIHAAHQIFQIIHTTRKDNRPHLVIVSGDSDFIPVVDLAHKYGIKVHILAFQSTLSKDLADTADSVIHPGIDLVRVGFRQQPRYRWSTTPGFSRSRYRNIS